MKATGALLLLTLLFCFSDLPSASGQEDPNCDQYPLGRCGRNLQYVCGTDGVTYSNPCMLCKLSREAGQNIHIARYERC